MNRLLERLRKTFEDEEARYVYADSTVNAFIAAQIKALREERQLSQEELAGLVGTKQSGISRLEKADYSSWKVETLRKLARAFGVRLRISFEEFGTLLPDIGGFSKERLAPRKFEEDSVFKVPVRQPDLTARNPPDNVALLIPSGNDSRGSVMEEMGLVSGNNSSEQSFIRMPPRQQRGGLESALRA